MTPIKNVKWGCGFLWLSGAVLAPQMLCAQQAPPSPNPPLELTRAARPWEFVSAVGMQSGLLGNESGDLEAWVYPLKVLRDFHLSFKVDGETIEGSALVRSVSVQPQATTITYVWDTFTVRETLFAPVHEAGAIVALDIDASEPIELTAAFEKDFALEWPGAMDSNDIEWNATLHAFSLSDDNHKFTALVGSPSATQFDAEDITNYTRKLENSFGFGPIPVGKTTKVIVIAGSFTGLPAVETTYKKLSLNYLQLRQEAGAYYQDYLNDHIALELPDKALQQAYEWAQVSVLQGLVDNPFLGKSLIAGYRGSGNDARPGFAWFFGRDALWTALALDAEGDFATTKDALEFLSKYQKADGKIPHEISQSASFVPWFQSMPYAYASADATPLFIIATQDYVQRSGDRGFAQQEWDNLWRAYLFMIATYDADGIPRNEGVGHGWIEGGPLYPVKSELYQSAVVLEAIHALADIAHVLRKTDIQISLQTEFTKGKLRLNKAFWIADKHRYAYGLDARGAQLDIPSVLTAVPMWFGLLDEEKARPMLGALEQPEIQADWGMRIIPTDSAKFEPAGYHSGTVWPLFTGWASVSEYRYHHALSAYENLRANALLTFDGSLGNLTEVLTGNYYQTLATGSPHQIWSSAMVISPILTGLFGLDTNALSRQVTLRPHIPADWKFFSVTHIDAGNCRLNIKYKKVIDRMTFEFDNTGAKSCDVELAPALSLRTQVLGAEVNAHSFPYNVEENSDDQHVSLHLNVADRPSLVEIRLKNDFGLSESSSLPSLGSTSNGLRIVKQEWSEGRDALTLDLASSGIGVHELRIWNPTQIATLDGAELDREDAHEAKLKIKMTDQSPDGDAHKQVIIHFNGPVKLRRQGDSEKSLKGFQE